MSKGEWDVERTDGYSVNFKGRRYNKCTPTDLDWVLEIKNKVLILAEVKRTERKGHLPLGQKILAENICSYINTDVIPVFFLYVVGDVVNGILNIEDAVVVSYYSNTNKNWTNVGVGFKTCVDAIIKKYAGGKR